VQRRGGLGERRAGRIPVAPAEASYANIRVTATDQAGNKLSQTIERAWAVN